MTDKKTSSYAEAGVDIDEMMSGLKAAKKMVKRTATRGVLSDIGSFGGLFRVPDTEQVLVSSTDGVGTKLKVAVMAGRHDTVGQDLVNHCVNDILVQGAKPLFFLDYLGTAKLKGEVFRSVIKGLCQACKENGCAVLGGETAEMPGLYPENEYDLVGTIVGIVDKQRIITGKDIRPGDMVIGLRSTGFHTNGYSLVRKVVFEQAKLGMKDVYPGTQRTVEDVLLSVHRSYLRPVTKVMKRVIVQGMAHITGGGLVDNVPRILPKHTAVVIDRSSWPVPPAFKFIQEAGNVDRDEMYRVFNMGIGYVLVVREKAAERTMSILKRNQCQPVLIGYVKDGRRGVKLVG